MLVKIHDLGDTPSWQRVALLPGAQRPGPTVQQPGPRLISAQLLKPEPARRVTP
jgi:hypothetical protein